MGPEEKNLRVVLDTNVVVSALVFERTALSWFRDAWQRVLFVPLVSQHAIREVIRALGYPKLGLDDEEVRELLGDYLPYAEVIVSPGKGHGLPVCRDPDDQPFLVLAQTGEADALVTGDRALLDLQGKTAFSIETPAAFRRRFS